ncbi:hypothetical protein J2X56_004993 [Herbaspirillum sp. 1173]|jgi:hypothetical protein|uniref:DUF2946 family protein n=1 Tax=unclassified Herbaspirillum TaxID=2624150 RepID=UPI001064752E|nr:MULTISPECIES: DUF2946 family protein [unclassified Herbaspirillum]MBP1317682.1 hypothetical protein [Herbaspirillum sp. 1130]MDR6742958.1 hypothetical protein [Herbaspirillum sp. 1173]
MSSRLRPSPTRLALRRPWLRLQVWTSLALLLAMVAAPWWQQAAARTLRDSPAMAICSVGGGASGNAPAHLAASHCPLCCGTQAATPAPDSSFDTTVLPGIGYPLAGAALRLRPLSLAPGSPRARAPPA